MTTTTRPQTRPERPSAAQHPRALAALVGVLSAALALGVAELLTALLAPTASPVPAVGEAVIALAPGGFAEGVIGVLGRADKPVLVAVTFVLVALLSALAGVLALRRRAYGYAVVVVLAAVAAGAAARQADSGITAVIPSTVGALIGLGVLDALLGRLERWSGADAPASGPARRSFLRGAGITAAVAVASGVGGRVAGAAGRGVSTVRGALRLPSPAVTAPVVPTAVDVGVDGVVPWQTSAADFYRIDTALVVPRVEPEEWTLRVHGMVEEEVEISFADLVAEPLVESWVTLTCVSNEVGGSLISNARWLGRPVRELLARARPTAGADMVLSTSVDGFTASTPLEALTDDDVDALLAVAMNGDPLPVEHGFPVRMVVPGLYGFVSATKWVVDLEVTTFAQRTAYWTDRGWSERGPVKTESRIEVPHPSAHVAAGSVPVAGTAWAQGRGISRVEVQVDDDPWQDAELGAAYNASTWRQWRWTWDAPEGAHRLRVRATDETGATQTEEEVDVVPDGATGWHTISVDVES